MGNKGVSSKKIIILDDYSQPSDFNVPSDSGYSIAYYNNFDEFIERQNLKNVNHIIVRPKTPSIQQKMQEIDCENQMVKVCPLILVQQKSMKQRLLSYIKNSIANPNIFLYVDDINRVKVQEHQKPYIHKVVSSIQSVIQQLITIKPRNRMKIRMNRMAKDLYRKIMVKIIDPQFISDATKKNQLCQQIKDDMKLLNQSGISYEFYESIEKFEKSSISTFTQYVIVKQQLLTEVIDSKKLLHGEYEIILRGSKDVQIGSQKKYKVWLIAQQLKEIIEKIKYCSAINSDEKPIQPKNTFLCGDDQIYENYFDEIKRVGLQKFKEIKNFEKMNFQFLPHNTSFNGILQLLKNSVYSYVVVFEPGQYLQRLKAFLKMNKFDNRVQLTKIPKAPKTCKTIQEILNYKTDFLVGEVKYKIKFQIAPITNIHCYRLAKSQITFFEQQMGIDVNQIKSQSQILQKYVGPIYQQFIESELIVCNVEDFISELRPLFSLYQQRNSQMQKVKYIIIDGKAEIRAFISNSDNYCEQIIFVHNSFKAVKQFLEYVRRPAVSIPYYGKGVLSNFHKSSKELILKKSMNTLDLKASVISMNKVINEIFKNKVRISSQYEISLNIFPDKKRGVQKVIQFYEQVYLSNLAKLFSINYDMFEKSHQEYVNLEVVKKDIIFTFQRCKTYELINLTSQDFKQLYINRIKQCHSLIDLQIACIYILSLPHGFDKVISNLFNYPRKYMMVSKIFSHFLLIILTAFYSFHQQNIQKLELVSYIQEDDIKNKTYGFETGNIAYSTTFIFCRSNSRQTQSVNKNSLIFQFENIGFLQKSKIRNNIYIEPFSFYKQGSQYIIPPQTKFAVKSKILKSNGYYEIRLTQVQKIDKTCFIEKILNINGIDCHRISQILNEQLKNHNISSDMKKKVKIYSKQTSLYKKTELMNTLQSKKQLYEQYQKSVGSLDFFYFMNRKLNQSALLIIEERINKIRQQQIKTGLSNLQLKKAQKMFGIQKALIYFKMSEYPLSKKLIQDLINTLEIQEGLDGQQWIIQTLNRFMKSIDQTVDNRKKVFENTPKIKSWKVKPTLNNEQQIQFKLKSRPQKWNVNYQQNAQIFSLSMENKPHLKFMTAQPENQFGSPVFAWINLEPYKIFEIDEKNDKNRQQQKHYQIDKPKKNNSKKSNSISKNNSSGLLDGLFGERQRKLTGISKQLNIDSQMFVEKSQQNKQIAQKSTKRTNYDDFGSLTKIKQINEESIINKEDQQIFEAQNTSGITQKMEWQIFNFDGQVKIVSKKRHFHAKMNKNTDNSSPRKNHQNPQQKQANNFILG